MRAAWYERKGAAKDVLVVGEAARPEPAAGEVLVRVHASGANPSDTKMRSGWGGDMSMAFPRVVPHQDGAGVIEAVGQGVAASRVGERVWIFEAQQGRPFGTAADYVAVPAAQAVPLPDGTSFAEGACLGVPAMTAHRCVFQDGPVAGQVVLVTGGAGSVGRYAVQFAKRGGAARVIATVSGPAQAESARTAGADAVIDYTREDVPARVAELTGAEDGGAVDRVIDVAFGSNVAASARALKPNGIIATYASDAAPEPALPFYPLLIKGATIHLNFVYAMPKEAHEAAARDIVAALAEGALSHAIGLRLPLSRIAEAHEAVERGGAPGKVLLDLDVEG